MSGRFAELDRDGRRIALEYAWIAPERRHAPLIVFLHEGLGSLALWKDFPTRLCAAGGCRGLVYSREGYGRSTPRDAGESWPVTFMHTQAHDVLPRLLARLGVTEPPWLFGHSDGASIALLHAARFPQRVAGVIAVAPHVFVEDLSVASIAATRRTYEATDLRAKLARYHADVDSAFYGWNDVWLDPAFRRWNIEDELAGIRCPVLAVQGEDDEYGSVEQVRRIGRGVPQARVIELAACGHSPHRDQPQTLIREVVTYLRGSVAGTGGASANPRIPAA
jgi:pimeloyl-ACP methyl ester carboxylesterase